MGYFKAFFDDRDGRVNPATALAAILVFASITWVSYLVFKNHLLPDLTGIAYLLGGTGAMNVANRMESIVGQFRSPTPDPPPAPTPPSTPPFA